MDMNYKDINQFFKTNTNYFRGLIILLICFNSKLTNGQLNFLQSDNGKIIFAILIALFLYFDSILGVLLTVYYLTILSEFNSRYRFKIESFINKSIELQEKNKNVNNTNPTCRNNFNF